MPKENKKRGRREEKKRKRDEEQHEVSPKRQRVLSEDHAMHDVDADGDIEVHGDAGDDLISFGLNSNHAPADTQQNQFYGLLEPEEQEYYANVNSKISANDFESDEDRELFIQAVHRETQGKEMKVASSQSCSRYLEKVILLSAADQLKSLFSAFLENLNYLVQHRFGSHCCETLFSQAAKYVNEDGGEEDSLEALYLRAVEQLQPNIGFLLTERFASHTIRVLLLVLSGEPIDDEPTRSMIASKRKEKLDMAQVTQESTQKRKVSKTFGAALDSIVQTLLLSMDATYLRALATHPTGNPVLQLLIKLELSASGRSKAKSGHDLLNKLLPDEDLETDSESGKLITGLMYDPTGSHLVETLIQHLPGKQFKKLYKNILKDRLRNLSKNDVASFVAIKVLERLGKDDLIEATNVIMNEIPDLVTRHRLNVIKVLFERCGVREVDTKRLAEAVRNAYSADNVTLLPKMMQFHASIEDLAHHATVTAADPDRSTVSPYKADVHGSLLAQAMLQVPSAAPFIHQSILAQPQSTLLSMAKTPTSSRVLQIALTTTCSPANFRRQLVPMFYGTMADLAINPAGSHVADALWHGTAGLHFMKEKLAKELQGSETVVRNSNYGRTVWRNWRMDSYGRHFREWQAMAKGRDAENGGEVAESQKHVQKVQANNGNKGGALAEIHDDGKTPIQRARERHAVKKARAGAATTNGEGEKET